MPRNTKLVQLLLITVLCGSAPIVLGDKVYKWVDKDGNVVYQDRPPDSAAGKKVEEKNINPNKNVIESDFPPVTNKTMGSTKGSRQKQKKGSASLPGNTKSNIKKKRAIIGGGASSLPASPPPPPPPPGGF